MARSSATFRGWKSSNRSSGSVRNVVCAALRSGLAGRFAENCDKQGEFACLSLVEAFLDLEYANYMQVLSYT